MTVDVVQRNQYHREWSHKNKDKIQGYRVNNRQNMIDNRRHIRMEVLLAYGAECVCCGERRYEFLVIDHVNGGGNEERKHLGSSEMIFRNLRKLDYPTGYRVLCHNCNMAYGLYGYCPH